MKVDCSSAGGDYRAQAEALSEGTMLQVTLNPKEKWTGAVVSLSITADAVSAVVDWCDGTGHTRICLAGEGALQWAVLDDFTSIITYLGKSNAGKVFAGTLLVACACQKKLCSDCSTSLAVLSLFATPSYWVCAQNRSRSQCYRSAFGMLLLLRYLRNSLIWECSAFSRSGTACLRYCVTHWAGMLSYGLQVSCAVIRFAPLCCVHAS